MEAKVSKRWKKAVEEVIKEDDELLRKLAKA
jgi:hypothetical protein